MRRRRAFSLAELLVVIGIIAVLISILIPVLHNAREQARAVGCASNMRQVMQATLMYVNDNHGAMPFPKSDLVPGTVTRRPYYAIQLQDVGWYDYEHGALWPYVASDAQSRQRVFLCPSDGPERFAGRSENTIDLGRPRNFSYNFNYELVNPIEHPDQWGFNINQIRSPSHKIIVHEQERPSGPEGGVSEVHAGANSNSIVFDLTTRHQGASNEAFADGHVERIDPKIFDNPTGSSVFTKTYAHYILLGTSER